MVINTATLIWVSLAVPGGFLGYSMNVSGTVGSFYVVPAKTGTQTVVSGFQCNCVNLGGSHLWLGQSGSCSNEAPIPLAVSSPPPVTTGACCVKPSGTVKSPSISGSLLFPTSSTDPCLP